MKCRSWFLATVLAVLAAGCTVHVGGVRPQPTVRRVSPTIPKVLRVYLGPDIKDKFTVRSASVKPLEFSRYRGSVAAGALHAFRRVFRDVHFVTSVPQDGKPYLIVHYAKPKHLKKAAMVRGGTVTNYEIGIKIAYDCELFASGKKIAAAGNTVAGDESTSVVYQINTVLRSALEAMYMDMVKTLLNETTVGALRADQPT